MAILLYEEALTNRTGMYTLWESMLYKIEKPVYHTLPRCTQTCMHFCTHICACMYAYACTQTHTQSTASLLLSGYSVLNVIPCPHFRDGNTGAYIGQQVAKQL